jgi:outer membrane receptor for ferrienterochelin and colicins
MAPRFPVRHLLTSTMLTCAATILAATSASAQSEEAAAPSQAAGTAGLEPVATNGRQVYDAALFARFAPQTAGDMARQIPGFTFTQVSDDRGLGEASQNVLINQQRLSSKSNDALSALDRIPASSVIRLEIADGATLNVSGLSGQVMNVVTKQDSFSGNFAYRPGWRTPGNHNYYNGEINVSGKLAGGDFTLGLGNNNGSRGGGDGEEFVRDANGNLLFTRNVRRRFAFDTPRLSASFAKTFANSDVFNVNAAVEHFRFRRNVSNLRFEPGASDIYETDKGSEDEWNYEASTDYEFGLAGGRLKLIGYHRFEHSPFKNLFRLDFDDGSTPVGTQFDRVVDESETVGRAEYRWKAGASDWQLSFEGALNSLEADAELLQIDSSGEFQPVTLPGASARVEEKRGQAILSYGRPIGTGLNLQGTLGGEYSELSQSGANGLTRSFIRPKGSVSLAWKASPRLDISARVQRKVGQLNFGDFLASVDVVNNNSNASNPELVPPQSWLAEVEFNRSLGPGGSIKLKLEGEKLSDIVDQVPITPTSEAPGNLDSATRYKADIATTFLGDPVGLQGVKLDIRTFLQKTSVLDPLTLVYRRVNNDVGWGMDIDLRHDIPGSEWAWGAYLGHTDPGYFYRLDYRFRNWQNRPFGQIYVEHKDVLGLKVRAQVNNVTNQVARFEELFYADRRDGPIETTEDMTVRFGQELRLQVSGTF